MMLSANTTEESSEDLNVFCHFGFWANPTWSPLYGTGTLPTQTSHISHPSHKTVHTTQALCPHKHPTSHTRPTKLYTQHRHSAHTNIPHLTPVPQNCTHNTGTLPTQTSHISHPSHKTVQTTQALCPHKHPTSHTRPTKLYTQHRHSAHTNIPHLTPVPQNCTNNTGTLPTQTSHISHPSHKTVHTTQALCPHKHPTSHTHPAKLYIQHRHSAHTNIPHLTPVPQNCTYNTGTLPTQTSHISHPSHKTVHTTQALCPHNIPHPSHKCTTQAPCTNRASHLLCPPPPHTHTQLLELFTLSVATPNCPDHGTIYSGDDSVALGIVSLFPHLRPSCSRPVPLPRQLGVKNKSLTRRTCAADSRGGVNLLFVFEDVTGCQLLLHPVSRSLIKPLPVLHTLETTTPVIKQ